MRRYRLAIHILVILSVFNSVLVLAAPVLVQEVREAGIDVAGGGEDVVIMLGKRGGSEEGQDPLTQASPAPGSSPTSEYGSAVSLSPDHGGAQPGTTSEHLPSSPMRTEMPTIEIGPATPPELSGEIDPGKATPYEWSPPRPQSNTVLSKMGRKAKGFFRKLRKITKILFSKMVDNPHVQIRTSAAASGAVDAAHWQRELQDTAHTEAYVSTSFLSYKHSNLMVSLSVTL